MASAAAAAKVTGSFDPAARSSAASRHSHRRIAFIVPDRVQPADGRIEIAQHDPVERLAIVGGNSINWSSRASSAGSPEDVAYQISRPFVASTDDGPGRNDVLAIPLERAESRRRIFPCGPATCCQLWKSTFWPERASKNLDLEAAPFKIDRAVVRGVAIDVDCCRQCGRIRYKCQCNQSVHLLASPR